MTVLVLGVAHDVQEPHVPGDPLEHRKVLLEKLLRQLVFDGAKFIGEEARFKDDDGRESCETIAKQVANAEGMRWRNVDMPKAARELLGIDHEQQKRPSVVMLVDRLSFKEAACPPMPFAKRSWFGGQRESGSADSIVIVCGNLHVVELARRFKADGHQVAMDYLHDYA